MFFPRLRAHAKWVFVLLAIVFAGGFVFLGVGSGSGIGDLLSGNIGNLFGGGGTSVSGQIKKDRSKIRKNPKDVAAYRDLASALRGQNKTLEAIQAYQGLLKVKPKDVDALTQLAALYLQRGDEQRSVATAIQAAAPSSDSSTFLPPTTSPFGKALSGTADPVTGFDPIDNAVTSKTTTASSKAFQEEISAYQSAVATYKTLAALTPNDPLVQTQLATAAEQASDSRTAIAAYKRFLVLAPQDPLAPAVRQRLKQLEASQSTRPASATGG
jgi:DNA-binding SARP family transcriptional activator